MGDDDRLTGAEAGDWFDFFISRAAADTALALRLSDVLNAAGFATLLQDGIFGHEGFMAVMPEALARGARVIALLTDNYLADASCVEEALGALAGDPRNRSFRLIPVRVGECTPRGLVGRQRIFDLVPLLGDDDRLSDLLLRVVGHEHAKADGSAVATIETPARPLVHPRIARPSALIGRAGELQSIDRAFQTAAPGGKAATVVLQGKAGAGLAALARHYAFTRREHFAGVWWLDGRSSSSLHCGLRSLATDLLPTLAGPGAARTVVERLGSGLGDAAAPWLIVCDGAAAAEIVAELRPGPGIAVLATSAPGLVVPGAVALEVPSLSVADASQMLRERLPGRSLSAGEAQSLAAALGGHPLSIALASAYLARDGAASLDSYVAGLSRHQEEVPPGATYDRRFRACLWQSLEAAEAEAEEAGAVLAFAAHLAPNDIPVALYELAADLYPDELQPIARDTALRERVLGILERLGLVERAEGGRLFGVHPLVQQALRHALGSGSPAAARMAGSAAAALDEIFPDPTPENAPVCDGLVPHVLAVAEYARGLDALPLGRLLNVCGLHLSAHEESEAPERLYRQALAVVESSRGPIHPDLAATLINLGTLLSLAGRIAEADPLLERALAIARSAFGAEHPDTVQIRETLERLRSLPQPAAPGAPPPGEPGPAGPLIEGSAAGVGERPLPAPPSLLRRELPDAAHADPEPQRRRSLLDRLLRRD